MRASHTSLILVVFALACGGDGGGGGAPTGITPVVASITLSEPPASITVGESTQLSATALDAKGSTISNPGQFTWTSGSPLVASVDGSGKVVALAVGSTLITARVAGVQASKTVVVASGGAARDTISTLPQSFVPNLLTISAGSTVVFAFGGGIQHNVIFDPAATGRPADIQITKDVNVPRTFTARGTFKFDCTVHPGMRGEIDVQ
jgi:plastocyanin